MTPKLSGCCTKCDTQVYDVVSHNEKGEPIRIGGPSDDAVRVNFRLVNGSSMDLTFCRDCAAGLQPHDYPFLWQRVMLSWEVSTPGHPNQKEQSNNGILALNYAQPWKEVR